MKRDGAKESLWQHNNKDYITSTITAGGDRTYDVLIIGAGITGISTALQLQKAGQRCVIAEAQNIAFGTTGGTTAHLNTFLDTTYSEIASGFGKESAQLIADATTAAIETIKKNIDTYKIECDFEEKEGYTFSLDEKQTKTLEDIVDTGKEMGLEIDYINDSPFPIPYLKIAQARHQAQFNPVKYLYALAKAFEDAGGMIFTGCRVTGLEEGEIATARTSRGDIKAHHVVYATHIPPGVNLLHFRCAPYRSYAMAVKLKNDAYPKALGYDLEDPYHYYRSQVVDGEEYLVAGGEDHKTGHEENTDNCFRKLEAYLRRWFEIDRIAFRWSSQYYVPADGLAYIGHLPGNAPNVYVATGFNGNGMIYGTIAADVLSGIIINKTHPLADLLSPGRVKPVAGFAEFVKEGADVVKEFIKGKLAVDKLDSLAELAPGEARLVKYDGERMGLYRDEQHRLHAVNPSCTHIHCSVQWNTTEQSWDCPCHGARYSGDGIVLTGPAQKDLETLDLE